MGRVAGDLRHELPNLLPTPTLVEPFDAANCTAGQVLTPGWIWTVRVTLARPRTLSRLWAIVYDTAGTGLVNNQCLMGVYDASGARVALTASLHTTLNTVGVKSPSLVTPIAATAGDYYLAALINGSTGPNLLAGSVLGGGNAGKPRRFALAGTGATTLPSSITPGSLDGSISSTIWLGAD